MTSANPLLPQAIPELAAMLDDLAQAATRELAAQGSPRDRVVVERRLLLKYEGTDMTLPIALVDEDRHRFRKDGSSFHNAAIVDDLASTFSRIHRERYGFTMDEARLVVDAAEVEAIDPGVARPGSDLLARRPGRAATRDAAPSAAPDVGKPAEPSATAPIYTAGRSHRAAIYARESLAPGSLIAGPAIIFEPTSTTVVEPGWAATVLAGGELVLQRRETPAEGPPRAPHGRTRDAEQPGTIVCSRPPRAVPGSAPVACSPLLLEVFNNLFMSCAEQMGAMLRNTARSVNVKERLDFSCAVFDERGRLIANAPHLPVHLGSMGETVRAVLQSRGGQLRPGDAVLVNSPYNGGTHLPDLTVVSPVFVDDEQRSADGRRAADRPLFYVASRAHHADIGGTTPGSMPPDSRTIHDEGVLISDLLLVDGGSFREGELVGLLSSGPHPARNVPQNVADLKAQVAANARGNAELQRVAAQYGADVVTAYVGFVFTHAEESVRRVLRRLSGGAFECLLDDGDRIAVRVDVDGKAGSALIDFTGTSGRRPDNFNAPQAVTIAAVLYVVRTLVDVDIPLNEGCLAPLRIIIPDDCLLAAQHPSAVAAGNVEISQLVTDALFGAFGVLAGSQGTMNNLTFGNDHHQYYETICGGVGAGNGFHGCSAVHSHMTNSRLTDPEVLEWRHPVVVEEFALRRGSGGGGRWRGGDGVRRRLRFREPMTTAIVSGRRRVAPHGLAGGLPGACGRNAVLRAGNRPPADCPAPYGPSGRTARSAHGPAAAITATACDGGAAPSHLEELGGVARVELAAGDVIVVETPGGGGFGSSA